MECMFIYKKIIKIVYLYLLVKNQIYDNLIKTFSDFFFFFRNPWPCDKLTYDLQIYLTRRNIQYHAVCAKSVEPKKFEKMVVYNPRITSEKHRPLITSNSNIKKVMTKKHPTSTPKHENTVVCVNATNEANFMKALNSVSPYWFFGIGFLLGVACGMLTCYVWLTRKLSCCCRQTDNDAQRVSLLQNLWQFEDSVVNDSAISCPDTPPPPYYEVMLRPGLYRNTSVTTNLNDTEYT